MIYLKGDTVKLKSGEVGEIVDSWGIAREWFKVKTTNGVMMSIMSDSIDSLISRHKDKKKWR